MNDLPGKGVQWINFALTITATNWTKTARASGCSGACKRIQLGTISFRTWSRWTVWRFGKYSLRDGLIQKDVKRSDYSRGWKNPFEYVSHPTFKVLIGEIMKRTTKSHGPSSWKSGLNMDWTSHSTNSLKDGFRVLARFQAMWNIRCLLDNKIQSTKAKSVDL